MKTKQNNEKNARRLQIRGVDGVRRNLKLQGIKSKSNWVFLRQRLISLVNSKKLGLAFTTEEQEWILSQDRMMQRRLVTLGVLCEDNLKPKKTLTIDNCLEQLLSRSLGKTTEYKLRLAREKLLTYFGKTKKFNEISCKDVQNFWQHLISPDGFNLSEFSTAKRLIGYCRQIWNDAIQQGLIPLLKNPFTQKGISGTVRSNPEKHVYISAEVVKRMLEVIPEKELADQVIYWQLRLILMRFAGLRSPSELNALRWCDVNFELGRLRIHSPKLKHLGNRGIREMPIPPEVQTILEKAWSNNPTKTVDQSPILPTVSHHTLVKHVKRWLGAIEHKCWPALLNNFRRSAVTDAVNNGIPSHVVCAWFGHSEKISLESYRMVTKDVEDKFRQRKPSL
jgi:integrase